MSNINFIPVATSLAGSCLTAKNWQETGTTILSCHLASLVIKPGLSYLKTLSNLAAYMGWDGDVLLNASMPKPSADGKYILRSSYDGALITLTIQDIIESIFYLKPRYVILPKECNGALLQTEIQATIVAPDDPQFVESDVWASDACEGKVYTSSGIINLNESLFSNDFNVIDSNCLCPTCQQQFTRAYLYHLLRNTPLLCQRLLIQHNIVNNKLCASN